MARSADVAPRHRYRPRFGSGRPRLCGNGWHRPVGGSTPGLKIIARLKSWSERGSILLLDYAFMNSISGCTPRMLIARFML
jgi:hypothetical protein